jgi:hypothetical protein
MTVLSATTWNTNAEMMEDVVRLGYIRPDDRVIDLTFGSGKWWSKYEHPGIFVANFPTENPDMDKETIVHGERRAVHYSDFRDTGLENDHFDVVAFDPPYVSMGGRKTSGMPDFMDRYGLEEAARTPADLHLHNEQGLLEARRICKPGGFVMTKCADYISSGRLQLASHWMLDSALAMGFQVQDKLIHVGYVRAQPSGRRVMHARQNASTLWVLRKPRRIRTPDRTGEH